MHQAVSVKAKGGKEKREREFIDVVRVVSVDKVCLNGVSHKYVYVHACMWWECCWLSWVHLRRKREYHRRQ